MANNQELFELILKIQGQEKVVALKDQLADAERKLLDVTSAANLMGRSVPTPELAQYAQSVSDLKGKLASAESSLNAFGAAERKSAADAQSAADKIVAAEEKKLAAIRASADKQQAILDRQARVASGNIAGRTSPIDRALKSAPGISSEEKKAFDAARTAAKARFALFGANTLQDMVQGGPASGINNVLGAAGDGGIKALAGEALAAAGGIKTILSVLSGVGLAATSVFAVFDHGLKSSGLGWSDLGAVVENITGGAFSKAGKSISDAIGGMFEPLGKLTNLALDYWLGWDNATKAVKDHKAEIEANTKAMEKFKESSKVVAGFKSEAETKKDAQNKVIGEEIAALGGDEGADGVVDKLAWSRVGSRGADKETRTFKNDKGEEVTETRTKSEWAKITATNDVASALKGDDASRSKILGELKGEGFDTTRVEQAIAGRNFKEEEKKAKEDKKKAEKDELDNLNREAKEGEKAWDTDLNAAKKSKSFLGKDPSKLTPAEKEAKRLHDDQEAKVSTAMKGQTWLGKEDEDLSPEEKIGRRRFDQARQQKDERLRGIKEDTPELAGLLSTSLGGAMKFGNLEQAQAKLFGDLKGKYGEDSARSMIKEATGDARQNAISEMMNAEMPKSENATILNGASALRDNIQGSVKSPEYDLLQKQLIEYQKANQFLEELTKRPGGLG